MDPVHQYAQVIVRHASLPVHVAAVLQTTISQVDHVHFAILHAVDVMQELQAIVSVVLQDIIKIQQRV